jgi:hypothetical protein
MKNWGMGIVSLVGVPGIVFGIAYVVGCSNDAEDPAKNGEEVKGKCPADDNPCSIVDCSKGVPEVNFFASGTLVDAGAVPECYQLQCSAVDGGPETKAERVALPSNTTCSSGTCNGAGACIRANGAQCDTDNSCESGHCASGVCCDQPCSGECESCTTGTCLAVPFNTEAKTCIWPNTCDGNRNCKIGTGASCDGKTGADCVGGSCRGKCGANTICHDGNVSGCGGSACGNSTCVNTWGKPCNDHADCDGANCVVADAGTDARVCYN